MHVGYRERQQEIIRKIQALKRVAERTEFQGQKDAALAAVDRLVAQYEIDIEACRDEVKEPRVVAAKTGWRRNLAVHVAWYLGLEPTRPPRMAGAYGRGKFFVMATEAEWSLWQETFEFHARLIEAHERILAETTNELRREVAAAKKRLREWRRESRQEMKWYMSGYVGTVMPTGKAGKTVKATLAQAMANRAGADAGRRVQIEKRPRALTA